MLNLPPSTSTSIAVPAATRDTLQAIFFRELRLILVVQHQAAALEVVMFLLA